MKKEYNKKIIFTIVCLLILFNILPFYNVKAEERKNIIILNSYHRGFFWTDDEVSGALSAIKNGNLSANCYVEYMDWKRYPYESNLNNIYTDLKYKYSNKKIDAVLTTDDAALEFAIKNREELFSNCPIVFCGVNKEGIDKLILNKDRITGVVEQIDSSNTLKLIKSLNPNIKNIYLVYDNSESAISTADIVKSYAKTINDNLNLISLNNESFETILNKLKSLGPDSAVLITSFFDDTTGNFFEFEESSRIISQNSTAPVYHIYDVGLNNGIIGGSLLSGNIQGQKTGKIVLKVLNGENIDSIPYDESTTAVKRVDYNQLKKFRYPIKSVPKDYEIINKPFSFFKTYSRIVATTISLMISLVLLIFLLLYYNRKTKSMQKHIQISNDKLRISAYYDSLTKLPNKLNLYESLQKESALINPLEHSLNAIISIDIDNFKMINDSLGHIQGDYCINECANRLNKFSSENNILFRLEGDEFIYYIKNVKNKECIENLVNDILKGNSLVYEIGENKLFTTLSIGISMYPENGINLQQLLKYSYIAMNTVKSKGKNGYLFFNDSLNDKIIKRTNYEKYMRSALENEEFLVYYQPQINLKDNKLSGFEALLRWNSKELGFVSPLDFINIAEENGVIIPLGEFVLKKACSFIYNLNDEMNTNYSVAVNVSINQLLQDGFYDNTMKIIKETKISPLNLKLEVTESVLMDINTPVVSTLRKLYDAGICISIDDFGTGYSSLAYLKYMPVKELKIDKSFISDDNSKLIVDSIINLGHILNLNVVAEGIEENYQLNYLREKLCDEVQGYIFSKPIPYDEAKNFACIKNFNE